MKSAGAFLLLLVAVPPLLLRLPAQRRLEIYDVQDITYGFHDFPGVDIPLAGSPPDLFSVDYWTIMDLADAVRPFARGDVQAQNGMLIVRATALQHRAVRARLAAARLRIRLLEGLNQAAGVMLGGS